ncbi:MAG: glycine--tRNA ligase subunit beta [Holophagaceae bacterium]|nr:glycine--tRNA ligase subunit beta [Holophagaceae bacterium]
MFSDRSALATLDVQGTSNLGIESFYSPRKLAWRFSNLLPSQPDQTETQVGPPQKMCLDADGQATQTGQKFAEKWGVDFSLVRFEQPQGKKEPCAVVTITKKGQPTIELLAAALPKLIESLHVPKAMRWGNSEFEFVRPIRNVLSLEMSYGLHGGWCPQFQHHLGPSAASHAELGTHRD